MNEPFNNLSFDPLASPSFEGLDEMSPEMFFPNLKGDESDDMVTGGHLTELGALVFSDDPTALEGEFDAKHLDQCDACQLKVIDARRNVLATSTANRAVSVPTFPGLKATSAHPISLNEARSYGKASRRLAVGSSNTRNLRWLGVAAGVIGFTALGGSLLNRNNPTTSVSNVAADTKVASRSASNSSDASTAEKNVAAYSADTLAAAAIDGELDQSSAATETTPQPPAPVAAAPEVLGDVPLATTELPVAGSTQNASEIVRQAEPTIAKPAAAKRSSPTAPTVPAPEVTTLVPGSDTAALDTPIAAAAQAPPPTFPARFVTLSEALTVLTQQPRLFETLPSTHPCSEVLRTSFGFAATVDVRFVEVTLAGNQVVLGIARPETSPSGVNISPTTTLLGNWRVRVADLNCQLAADPAS